MLFVCYNKSYGQVRVKLFSTRTCPLYFIKKLPAYYRVRGASYCLFILLQILEFPYAGFPIEYHATLP